MTAQERFGRFWREWEEQLGEEQPAPAFTPGRTEDFTIGVRAVTVHDAVIAEVDSATFTGTHAGAPQHPADQLVLHVVRRNTWRFARPHQHEHTVQAGHFMVHRSGPPTFEQTQRSAATVLLLPASPVVHLIADRLITGPTSSAEMRLLLGHLNLVGQTAHQLTPSGALAARNALLELVNGVLRQQPDGTEPELAPALAQAARDLAERRLADPDISPSMLARELNVSVRTLHRAFAATEDSVAGYIRRRRLEEARRALLSPVDRPSVSELAAYWQFTDSSHFIRVFKRRYGYTPTELVRIGEVRDGPSKW